MNELTIVMDAIKELGAEGKSAFVWFLVMKYGSQAVAWTMGWGTIAFVATRIMRTIFYAISEDAKIEEVKKEQSLAHERAGARIRDLNSRIQVLNSRIDRQGKERLT